MLIKALYNSSASASYMNGDLAMFLKGYTLLTYEIPLRLKPAISPQASLGYSLTQKSMIFSNSLSWEFSTSAYTLKILFKLLDILVPSIWKY
jgi:hypothetical protein